MTQYIWFGYQETVSRVYSTRMSHWFGYLETINRVHEYDSVYLVWISRNRQPSPLVWLIIFSVDIKKPWFGYVEGLWWGAARGKSLWRWNETIFLPSHPPPAEIAAEWEWRKRKKEKGQIREDDLSVFWGGEDIMKYYFMGDNNMKRVNSTLSEGWKVEQWKNKEKIRSEARQEKDGKEGQEISMTWIEGNNATYRKERERQKRQRKKGKVN